MSLLSEIIKYGKDIVLLGERVGALVAEHKEMSKRSGRQKAAFCSYGSRSAPNESHSERPRSLPTSTTAVDAPRRIRGSKNLSTKPLREPSRRALSPR